MAIKLNNITITGKISAGLAAPPPTYATWNPADKQSEVVLSNGNLTCTNSGGETSVRATIGKSSGKWYWELTTNNFGTPSTYNSYACGISRAGQDLTLIVGYNMPNSYVVRAINETSVNVYSCSLDMDAGTFTVLKNGAAWAGSTAVGTAPTPGIVYYPTASPYVGGDNFTMNFGATAFVYTVPVGYNAGLYT